MKDKSFVIKVWDLLQEAGRTDEIQFSHKWTEQLPGLTDDGITGIVSLQSLSRDSVYVDLDNIECAIDSICDTCEVAFFRPVHIDHYWGKFVLWEENIKLEQEHTEEEIFAKRKCRRFPGISRKAETENRPEIDCRRRGRKGKRDT